MCSRSQNFLILHNWNFLPIGQQLPISFSPQVQATTILLSILCEFDYVRSEDRLCDLEDRLFDIILSEKLTEKEGKRMKKAKKHPHLDFMNLATKADSHSQAVPSLKFPSYWIEYQFLRLS